MLGVVYLLAFANHKKQLNQQKLTSSTSLWPLVVLIMAGEAIFFLPFVLPRIFRPTVLSVFEIDNFELGTYYSVYGLVAIAAYLFGGPLADRFAPSRLMALALFMTAVGGGFLYAIPAGGTMKLIYGFWGFSTIFLFWAALMRTTRLIGGTNKQGLAFGILDGGRGLFAALVTSVLIVVLGNELNGQEDPVVRKDAFQVVIAVMTSLVIVVGLLVLIFLRKVDSMDYEVRQRFNLSRVVSVISQPAVWLQAIIIICAYSGYRVTDDFSLLAKDALGYDEVEAAGVGSLSLWIRPLAAVTAGVLADWLKPSRIIQWCFGLLVLGGFIYGTGVLNPSLLSSVVLIIGTTSVAVFALRGLYFAIMGEGEIPFGVTGTVVGIASIIGYLPDVFMGPLMGMLLDASPGVKGHQDVFLLLAGFASVGLIATFAFRRLVSRKR